MFTNGTCQNCLASVVYDLEADAEVTVNGIEVENITIKESFKEDDFVKYIVKILNAHIKTGIRIHLSVAELLTTYYGVSPDYAKRLESLITPCLICPPEMAQI